jgi:phytoene dehydrogenase-like protein
MRLWNIGIVGGGPGGLMTAYCLQKIADGPVRITLFEASSRLGGKILTPSFRSAPIAYEAGAAEFYDYSAFDEDSLKDLILELGLPISPMGGSAVIMNHRVLANLDDIRDQLGAPACSALVAFDHLAKDWMTPQDFYHSDDPDGSPQPPTLQRFDSLLTEQIREPAARQYIENMIHSDLATEPCHTSPAYGLQNYVMNDPAYMRLYGIEGGNERLPRELAARIDATIHLEHTVQSVAKVDDDCLRIRSIHHGDAREDDFDVVVIALPHNRLPSVTFQGERLAGALQAHYDYYNYPCPLSAHHDPVRAAVLAEVSQRFLLDAGPFRRLLLVRRIVATTGL